MTETQFDESPYGFNSTGRLVVEEADKILYKAFKCLDNGFVRLVDYMGGDKAVVQAARVSYGAGTKKISEDEGLIRYLMRNRHTTPFEMVQLKFHVKVPMDSWRQWIRHRTASVNEYSTRYSVAIDEAQRTAQDKWRLQSELNKQGSGGFIDEIAGGELSDEEIKLQEMARQVYEGRLKRGVAREQARKDLPLSTYTEAYWKTDLHNLFHFLSLRMDAHAQQEIREYAVIMGEEITRRVAPISYAAFKDYRLNSLFLSEKDILAVKRVNKGEGLQKVAEDVFDNKREREEFFRKSGKLLD